MDVTGAQIFLLYFVSSAFSNSKDKWMAIKNQLPTLSKLYSIYEEILEDLLDEADIDSYFYHSILNITKKENRLVRLSKTANKNSFNLKVFKFDCSTIQQKYSLSEEITLTRRELGVVLDCLNDFLLQFETARQTNFYSLPTPEAPIGYPFLKDDLFLSSYTRDQRTFKTAHTTLILTQIERRLHIFSYKNYSDWQRVSPRGNYRFASLRIKKPLL